MIRFLFTYVLLFFCISCSDSQPDYWGDLSGEGEKPDTDKPAVNPNASKPRFIWIDAAANFPDFANSKENIAHDLALAKDAGFTDIVVDVRPTTGDVVLKTNVVEQVKFLYAWVSEIIQKWKEQLVGTIYRLLLMKLVNRIYVFMQQSTHLLVVI